MYRDVLQQKKKKEKTQQQEQEQQRTQSAANEDERPVFFHPFPWDDQIRKEQQQGQKSGTS